LGLIQEAEVLVYGDIVNKRPLIVLLITSGLTQNHDKTNRKGRKGHKEIRISESFA